MRAGRDGFSKIPMTSDDVGHMFSQIRPNHRNNSFEPPQTIQIPLGTRLGLTCLDLGGFA